MDNTLILLLGLFLEICFDWPYFFYRYFKHPIIWLGNFIQFIDKKLNKDYFSPNLKKICGFFSLLITLLMTLSFVQIFSLIFEKFFFVEVLHIFIVWSLMCSRSLYSHIKKILDDLKVNNLSKAKKSLSKVVGRDTNYLKKQGIIRASLESLSESTSDGFVAPLFWYCLFGIHGLVIFKTVNTLDSMIGYKSKKYLEFGYASAKLDDIFNYIPSRLTGVIFVIISSRPLNTFRIMINHASKLNSPNAGWPEAAFAGALMIKLGGPKSYSGTFKNDMWLNEKCNNPNIKNFEEGLYLYIKFLLLVILIIVLSLIFKFI